MHCFNKWFNQFVSSNYLRGMNEVYIVSVARTPIGNLGGALSKLSAVELGKVAIEGALKKANIKGDQVEEVILGNVLTANVGQAPAKQAALAAGIPNSVPCTTVNKVCSSGMKAIMLAAQAIQLGDRDVMLAGGMESMSNAPHYLPKARTGIRYGNDTIVDGIVRDGLQDPYDGTMMGNCGEVCATEKKIGRSEQDDYAFQSYARARAAYEAGSLNDEIVSVSIPQRKGEPIVVSQDEEVSNSRIAERASLDRLRPAFDKEGTITAANASKINDGAAAVVLMSQKKMEVLGLKPIARIMSFADAAQEPVWFTTTPSLAMPIAAEKGGVSMEDIDVFEINEAFSVVALANIQALNLDPAKVNMLGGAVAMGHPIGASGARIVITMTSALKANGGKYGLAGICNGGGGASAMLIENLQ